MSTSSLKLRIKGKRRSVTMDFDRMGRRTFYRETENGQQVTFTRFLYDGYVMIQQLFTNAPYSVCKEFIWDPTESVATKPLCFREYGQADAYLMHDGNKNVTDVIAANTAATQLAHYEYAPFGAVRAQTGARAASNPYRFSSEFADDTLGLVYYNYRHYEPTMGRWLQRDPIDEEGSIGLYNFVRNEPSSNVDVVGRNIYLKSRCQHQSICVDLWRGKPEFEECEDCNKKDQYDNNGIFCLEFAWINLRIGVNVGSDKWFGWDSRVLPTGIQLTGTVVEDKDSEHGGVVSSQKETTVCQDRNFVMLKMSKVIGANALYSLGRHNCRMFAQLMFEDAPGTLVQE